MKKNPILDGISAAALSRRPSIKVDVLDVQYKLQMPLPEGEDWAAMHTPGMSLAAYSSTARVPLLAVALEQVNGLDVDQLFVPDEEEMKKFGPLPSVEALRDWRRAQVLEFLSTRVDRFVVNTLFEAYSKMVGEYTKSLAGVRNL